MSNVCYKPLIVFFLLSDNRIESLIQKADQVLNTLSQSSGRADSPADAGETRTQSKTQGFSVSPPAVVSSKANVG